MGGETAVTFFKGNSVISKFEMQKNFDAKISLLRIYPTSTLAQVSNDTVSRPCSAALFIIWKGSQQPKCPSIRTR